MSKRRIFKQGGLYAYTRVGFLGIPLYTSGTFTRFEDVKQLVDRLDAIDKADADRKERERIRKRMPKRYVG